VVARAGGEQLGEDVVGVEVPFGGGGRVGADDGEAGEGAPAAAGGALLDFDGAQVAFGLVVGVMRKSYLG